MHLELLRLSLGEMQYVPEMLSTHQMTTRLSAILQLSSGAEQFVSHEIV